MGRVRTEGDYFRKKIFISYRIKLNDGSFSFTGLKDIAQFEMISLCEITYSSSLLLKKSIFFFLNERFG